MTEKQRTLMDIIEQNGWDVFSHQMLINDGSFNSAEIWEGLRYLVKNGTIVRIEKGKYYRKNFSNENVIACFIAKNSSIAYWSALNRHGLTEQFPNIIFVQNTQRSDNFQIPGTGTTIKFVKVKEGKVFGLKTFGYGNHIWHMTDIEKTIVDCFDLPQYSGAYTEIIKGLYKAKLSPNKLIDYCKKANNHSVTRRLGYLIELLKIPGLERFLEFALTTVNDSYILFENGIPKSTVINAKWKIYLNISENEIIEIAQSNY